MGERGSRKAPAFDMPRRKRKITEIVILPSDSDEVRALKQRLNDAESALLEVEYWMLDTGDPAYDREEPTPGFWCPKFIAAWKKVKEHINKFGNGPRQQRKRSRNTSHVGRRKEAIK